MKKSKIIYIICLFAFINLIFLDNVSAETYNNYSPATVACGGYLIRDIPSILPKVISTVYKIIQVAVPIVLVVMGSLDFFKAITSQKEEEMKKGQQMFIKRLIAAVIVFFVFVIVKVVISVAADSSSNRIIRCAECFIEDKCR